MGYEARVYEQARPAQGAVQGCCLEEMALEALTVPMLVHDDEKILFVNAEARRLLRVPDEDAHRPLPLADFIHPDLADAAAERRRLMFEGGASVRLTRIKGPRSDGSVYRAVLDSEPFCYEDGRRAAAVVFREFEDVEYVRYETPSVVRSDLKSDDGVCLHCAAFEALPLPAVVQDRQSFVSANLQSRMLLRANGSLAGTPIDSVTDASFAATAADRRHIVMDYGMAFRDASSKLRALDGSTLYIVADGAPVFYGDESYIVLAARNLTEILPPVD